MSPIARSTDRSATPDTGVENRRHPRIFKPFPTTARGVNADGEGFDITTVLENFSAGGLYLRLPERVEPGAKLFAVVHLSMAPVLEGPAPRVALRGVVVRVDPTADGECGVAIKFTRHRFL